MQCTERCLHGSHDKIIAIIDLSFLDESTDTWEKFHFSQPIFEYLLCDEHWIQKWTNGKFPVMVAFMLQMRWSGGDRRITKSKIILDGGQGGLLGGGKWSRDQKGEKAQEWRARKGTLERRNNKCKCTRQESFGERKKECGGWRNQRKAVSQRFLHPTENLGEECKRDNELLFGPK